MELINLYLSSIPDIAKHNNMFPNPLNGHNGDICYSEKVNRGINYVNNFMKDLSSEVSS